MSYGEEIRGIRARLGLTQEELATRSGLSVRALRAIETGAAAPRRSTKRLLAGVLDPAGESPAPAVTGPADGGTVPRDGRADQIRPPAEGGSVAVPPLTTRLPVPSQLPRDVLDFVGRTEHVAQISALLTSTGPEGGRRTGPPIVALSGMGGVGKTALAVHCAHQVRKHFPDGQLFVPLRGASGDPQQPDQVLARLLRGLAVPGPLIPPEPDEQAALFRSLVADQAVLLVLDDARDAQQVRPLLPGGGSCAVLVTSRRILSGVEGARCLALPPLGEREARRLLTAVRGQGEEDGGPAVSAILGHCAGLPLAIRIIAARLAVPDSDPAALAGRLGDSTRRLDGLVAEDLSVRATLDTSIAALRDRPAALKALRLLGRWPGLDLEHDALAAGLALPARQVRAALRDLEDSSLLLSRTGTHYHLHDLVRLTAAEQPDAEDGTGDPLARAMDWYLRTMDAATALLAPYQSRPVLSEPANPLPPFADHWEARTWCNREYPTLLALIRHSAHHGQDHYAWHLAGLLMPFFEQNMYWAESVEAHRIGLECARRSLDASAVAKMLIGLAAVHLRTRRFEESIAYCRQGLEALAGCGDYWRTGTLLDLMARDFESQGLLAESVLAHQEALAARRLDGNPFGLASTLDHLGHALRRLGRHDEALACHLEGMDLNREHGISHGFSATLQSLGLVHRELGDLAEAESCFRQAVEAAREVGDRVPEGESLRHLGDVLTEAGRPAEGAGFLRAALAVLEELNHPDAADLRARV